MPQTVSRRSRWMLAPLILVVILALGWSALWLYGARVAENTIAAWIEREGELGRVHTCGSRKVGGYPFRIEVRCTEPTAELRLEGTPTVVLKARELLAVAQVYTPGLVIAEIAGPMTVTQAGEAPLTADWTLLQASVRGQPAAPERVSVVADRVSLARAGEGGPAAALARADHVEFHVRRSPQSDAGALALDLALQASGAVIPSRPAVGGRPLDADAAAVLRGVADLAPKPLAVRLREWQAAGGRLEIAQARVRQGDALALARGDLGLNARGRLDGTLTLTVAGFEEVARLLGLPSLQVRGQGGGLLAGLSAALGGQTELEGKRAMTLPLRLNDGRVFVGPIPLMQVPPAF